MAPTIPGRFAITCAGGASGPAYPRGRRRPRRGRPYRFCRATYRVARAAVERFFAWLKGGFRRLALRYERRLATFAALVHLACFMIVGVTQLAVFSFPCHHDSRSNPPPARGGQANESTPVG
jgi:hypothetical protein